MARAIPLRNSKHTDKWVQTGDVTQSAKHLKRVDQGTVTSVGFQRGVEAWVLLASVVPADRGALPGNVIAKEHVENYESDHDQRESRRG